MRHVARLRVTSRMRWLEQGLQVGAADLEHGRRRAAATINDRRRERLRVGDDRQVAGETAGRHGSDTVPGGRQDVLRARQGRRGARPGRRRGHARRRARRPGTSTKNGAPSTTKSRDFTTSTQAHAEQLGRALGRRRRVRERQHLVRHARAPRGSCARRCRYAPSSSPRPLPAAEPRASARAGEPPAHGVRACRPRGATVPWPHGRRHPLAAGRPRAEDGGDLRRVVADLLLVVGGHPARLPPLVGAVHHRAAGSPRRGLRTRGGRVQGRPARGRRTSAPSASCRPNSELRRLAELFGERLETGDPVGRLQIPSIDLDTIVQQGVTGRGEPRPGRRPDASPQGPGPLRQHAAPGSRGAFRRGGPPNDVRRPLLAPRRAASRRPHDRRDPVRGPRLRGR